MVAAVHNEPDGSTVAHHEKHTVSLRFIPTETNCPPLAYKTEAQSRFDNVQCSPASLKFRSGVEYGIALQLPPKLALKSGTIQVACYECQGKEETLCWTDSIQLRKSDVAYYCNWRCRLPVSMDGQRTKIILSTHAQGFGVLRFPLLVKTYASGDRDGSLRGYPLGKLQFTFESSKGVALQDSEARLDSLRFESAPWRL